MAQGNRAFICLKYSPDGYGTRSSLYRPLGQDQGSSIRYEPFLGTYFFWHKWGLFIFRRVRRAVYFESEHMESLSLGTLGWSPEPIKMLVAEIQLWAKGMESTTAQIWRPRGRGSIYSPISWRKALSRLIRPMDSILLPLELKEKFIEDVVLR